ncbi:hypothetical protein [Mycolicibacterium sp. P9-64]|uniref:hypothetical protein n=1 Tax=Mycolicibacterium sp. P9-64 TaxID=2024612 RepID=UPI0011EC1366|nr:hypothetical protein [Mycolicibacterium sp. P9-64]
MGISGFDGVATHLLQLLDTIADLERALKALVDHGVIVGDSITGTAAAAAQRLLDAYAYSTSMGAVEHAQGRGEPDR